jgi:hypothetical protein
MLILECSQGCYGRTDGWKDERKEGRKGGRKDGRTVALLYPFTTSLAGDNNSLVQQNALQVHITPDTNQSSVK